MDRVFKAYMDASSLLVKEAHGGLWAVYKEDAPEDLIGVLVSRFPSCSGWSFGHPEKGSGLSVAMMATIEEASTTGRARGFLKNPRAALRWGPDGKPLELWVMEEVTPPCPEWQFSRLRHNLRAFGSRVVYASNSAPEWELWRQVVIMPATMAGTDDVGLADLRRALRAEGWTEVSGPNGRWWKNPNWV